jgi:import inner membrane translocase subunit TIM44
LFISYTRAFTDRVSDAFGSIFEESDQAQAIRAFQGIDPTFNMDKFMIDARTYIVPELMEAYLKGDVDTLKLWCSEATYNVLTAVIQAQMQQGLISDCKIQDLRDIELVAAKILENDVPVLVLSFRTQEIIVFRNAKSGEIVYGKEVKEERKQ